MALACRSGTGELLMPCGRCRQVIYEFGGEELLVDTPTGPGNDDLDAAGRLRPPARPAVSGFAAVDVIIAKRDGRELTGEQIDWVIDAYTRGEVAEEQMSALLMAILLNGMTGGGDRRLDHRDDQLRDPDGPVRGGPADGGQALDGRCGGQDLAAAGAVGRGLRGGRSAAVRSGPGAHRRHPGQDGIDPGLAGDADAATR